MCLLALCQFGPLSQRTGAVVPPATRLEETNQPSDQPKDKRLEKAIEALETQEDRLRAVIDHLDKERERLERSQDDAPAAKPAKESAPAGKEKPHGSHLH